jgi:hypothetical protein
MQPTGWHELWVVLWNSTWGNNTAWLESLILLGIFTYVFKDYIGMRLAKWWHKHHKEHDISNHLEALRRFEAEKTSTAVEDEMTDRKKEAE